MRVGRLQGELDRTVKGTKELMEVAIKRGDVYYLFVDFNFICLLYIVFLLRNKNRF
jgi:hypothetical protein